MNRNAFRFKQVPLILLVVLISLLTAACATTKVRPDVLPPVLTQDEISRPYKKLATIEVRRERYGSPADLTAADYGWATQALREEGAKIGADAIIFPEINVEEEHYLFFPSNEMKAKGVAIQFR